MNRKRVQMLRDMLEGIPEEQIVLDDYYSANGRPCGTIACIAGWAAIYPPFVKDGLQKNGSRVIFRREYGQFAAAEFFDVHYQVFAPRQHFELGTHKQIAIARLDALLDH